MNLKYLLQNGSTTIISSTHEEWLNSRQGTLGSSEIGTVAGVNKYDTCYQLYRRKKGLDLQKEETFEMQMGHLLEPIVAHLYEKETASQIVKESEAEFVVKHPTIDYFQASPDRYFYDQDNELCILECKTTQMKIDPLELPKYWICQLQWQLGICGLKKGVIAWLISGHIFGYKEFDFDSELFRYLEDVGKDFWERYIIGDEIPDVSTPEDIAIRYPAPIEGTVIEATDEILETINKLSETKRQKKELEERQKELENTIKSYMKDNEILSYSDQIVCTWKTVSMGKRFDSTSFCKENPDLAQQYSKESRQRRFLLKA